MGQLLDVREEVRYRLHRLFQAVEKKFLYNFWYHLNSFLEHNIKNTGFFRPSVSVPQVRHRSVICCCPHQIKIDTI